MDSTAKGQRATGWAWIGFLLIFAGAAAYMALIDIPLFHSTGAPAFALMAAGVASGLVAAMRDRRIWVRFLFVVDVFLLGLWTLFFYVLAALPAPTTLPQLVMAPDFTLQDHNGQEVAFSAVRAEGPVLLVFYRGHW